MRRPPSWWMPALAALAAGAWTAALIPHFTPATWLLVPFSILAGGLMQAAPIPAAMVLLIGNGASQLIGLSFGDIEFLMPNMAVLFLLARRYAPLWPVVLVSIGLSLTALARTRPTWVDVVIVVAFYTSMVIFGRLVRRRAQDAKAAVRETARLAGLDIDKVIRDSIAAQRIRLTTDSLSILRSSLIRMRELAKDARTGLHTDQIDAIRAEGDNAIATLHGVLSALNERRSLAGQPPPPAHQWRTMDLRPWLTNLSLVVGGIVISVVIAIRVAGPLPGLIALAALGPLAVLMARRAPLISGVVFTSAYLMTFLAPAPHHNAMPPIAVCLGLVVWRLVAAPSWQSWLSLGLVVSAAFLAGARYGPSGAGFVVAVSCLSAVASWQWEQKNRIVLAAQIRSARLSAAIAAAQANAERTERQRVARELHDGISYAITAMSLQAQAALVRTESDPATARRHLVVVEDVGAAALADIETIASSVRQSAASGEPTPWVLLAEAHARGQQIDFELCDDFPPGTLAYRIIQESLTNAARYAPDARIKVEAGRVEDDWVVRITDTGSRGRTPAVTPGTGSGLRGLAQRVIELGGTFAAGPHGDGFEVLAKWPISAPVTTSLV